MNENDVNDDGVDVNESQGLEALSEDLEIKVQPDLRTVVRFPYKECFKCSHLMDWKDDIYDCFGTIVCPASLYRVVKGMDPELYVEQKAIELADLQLAGSIVEYAELLGAVTEKKPKLAPRVLNRASEIIAKRAAEEALQEKINTVA